MTDRGEATVVVTRLLPAFLRPALPCNCLGRLTTRGGGGGMDRLGGQTVGTRLVVEAVLLGIGSLGGPGMEAVEVGVELVEPALN